MWCRCGRWPMPEDDPFDLSALDEEEERPAKRGRGRPPQDVQLKIYRRIRRHVLGHDTTTDIGRAGWRYERLRKFIRKKGWHIGRPNWRSELLNAVARKTGVNPATLDDYAHRGAR